MEQQDLDELLDLAGLLSPFESPEERMQQEEAWMRARTTDDVPTMLDALEAPHSRWDRETRRYIVGEAIRRLCEAQPERMLPVMQDALRTYHGAPLAAAAFAAASLPEPVALDLLRAVPVERETEEVQTHWVDGLADVESDAAREMLVVAAENQGLMPAAREAARQALERRP